MLFKNHTELDIKAVSKELETKPEFIDALYNTIKYELNKKSNFNYPLSIFWAPEAHNMILCNRKLEGIKVRAEVHKFDAWKLARCLQKNRRYFIDSGNDFDDYSILRNAHFALFISFQVIGHLQ